MSHSYIIFAPPGGAAKIKYKSWLMSQSVDQIKTSSALRWGRWPLSFSRLTVKVKEFWIWFVKHNFNEWKKKQLTSSSDFYWIKRIATNLIYEVTKFLKKSFLALLFRCLLSCFDSVSLTKSVSNSKAKLKKISVKRTDFTDYNLTIFCKITKVEFWFQLHPGGAAWGCNWF